MAWVVAWNLNLRYACAAALVSRGWGSYFIKFFDLCGLELPRWLNSYPYHGFDFSIVAPICLIVLCFVQNRGSNASKNCNNFLTCLKISILIFIIGLSFSDFKYKKNFTPTISKSLGFKGVI